MRSLYLECENGISGDMTVAALLDLGADEAVLRSVLEGIKDDGFKIEISRVLKAGIDCCDFNVVLDEAHENHDHDMEYLYGHEEHHEHHHEHDHEDHHHEHHHDHHHHDHHHGRNLKDIEEIIDSLSMTDGARALAKKVFLILAKAESKAHNKPIDEIHFHEVGAIDSIVDIVAAAVCFDNLNISEVIVKKICEGTGSVRCQHGILPVPVPAVANIAEEYGLPISITDRNGELITPTGAAFVAAVMTGSDLPGVMKIVKTGLGAGKREYPRPSILRAILFENGESAEEDVIWKLESNIDDSSGEQLGYVMEELFEAGARDVFYSPVYMKKNRPAWILSVITTGELIGKMEDIIFRDTTTIGIRRIKMERTVLERRIETVNTKYGEAKVKICKHKEMTKVYPEYESAAELARQSGISIDRILREVVNAYEV
jgi:hypothetical protein